MASRHFSCQFYFPVLRSGRKQNRRVRWMLSFEVGGSKTDWWNGSQLFKSNRLAADPYCSAFRFKWAEQNKRHLPWTLVQGLWTRLSSMWISSYASLQIRYQTLLLGSGYFSILPITWAETEVQSPQANSNLSWPPNGPQKTDLFVFQ